MKKITWYVNLMLLMSVFSFSCSDNDDTEQPNSGISGTWSLISHQCCLSPSENFELSEILWIFSNNGEFTTDINIELDDNSQIPFQNSSTLSYTKTETTIIIDQLEYDYRIAETGELILSDSPESDGPVITLTK
jgi:hypothetical protein